MKKHVSLMVIAAAAVFAGCNKNDEPTLETTLSVQPAEISAVATAGSYSIAVTGNAAWTAAKDANATWLSLSPASATGNGTVTVNVVANPATVTRSATVTISSGTLSRTVDVTQAAAAPGLNVDKTAIDAALTAGNYSIAVTSNLAWTATKDANATWVSLSPASATGNGTVTVSVTENPAAISRAATITIAAGTLSRTVNVTQAAAALTLEVDKTAIDATATADTYTIGVTSNGEWTVAKDANATWLSLSPASATGNGTVTVNVEENPATVTRSATVTISSGTLSRTVDVTQDAAQDIFVTPTYAASTQTWTFGNQTWSDAIHIPECNKGDFNVSDVTTPDCRSYTESGKTWYYYNWSYVIQNANTLCPSPWRIPTFDDAMDIGGYTDYSELIAEWGLGGVVQYGTVSSFTNEAAYWTSTQYEDEDFGILLPEAWHLYYTSGVNLGMIVLPPAMAVTLAGLSIGMQVRCVK
ncbi:MAG: hypothetical protein LBG31_02515 [Prevotellaceae bacterium]|jgi:hypothetical protein|nr:hypothetical protein [Prevotellaceae bacterium]